jgi:hypothetical protein
MPINSPDIFNSVGDATISGGGGGDISIKEEGVELTSAVTSIDFVGKGVTASNSGSDVTVTAPASVFALQGAFFDNTIRNVYLPFTSEVEGTSLQRYNRIIIPIDCSLKKVVAYIISDQTAGVVAIDLRNGISGVSIESASAGGLSSGIQTWTYSSNSLSAGDVVALFMTGAGSVALGNVMYTVYFEVD